MEVETYEVTEMLTDGTMENHDEALALIEQLELRGQQKLLNPRTLQDGDTVTERNPYRLATKEELNIFHACFPDEVLLEDFSLSPIPLRVLQVAAHAKRVLPGNITMVVWTPEDSTLRDPVLLGKGTDRYNTTYYLLARWGEALESMEFLKEVAKRKLTAKVEMQIADLKEELAKTERTYKNKINAHLEGHRADFSYFCSISL
jgi:hypothetical protein